MSKRAFFIFGAEGSGTYMLAEAFVSAGCFYDDKLRESVPVDFHNNVVARLSIPCAGKFVEPVDLWKPYQMAGYETFNFIIFRDVNASIKSVMRRRDGMEYGEGWKNYGKALEMLSGILPSAILVSYEAFVRYEGYRKWLFDIPGLSEPRGKWFNGNKKYYV